MYLPREITLTPAEVKIASYIGASRRNANRRNGVADAQIGTDDVLDIDVNGMGGELAFCKLMNVYPDLTVAPRAGGEDCVINGQKYDVKTTKLVDGQLLVRQSKVTSPCDYYVLLTGSLPTYICYGWVAADDIFRDENIQDLGHGLGYVLPQERVRELCNG